MPHGRFTWYELMTTDTDAAVAFYGSAIGWGTRDASTPDMAYTVFTHAGVPVCGLMAQPDTVRDSGVPPIWFGHVAVDDVDAIVAQVRPLGGSVPVEPRDIPGVGRFAMIADPQGATFGVLHWNDATMGQPTAPMAPGRIGWHELMATDWEQALPFYAALFDWEKAEAVDIGAMGTYQLFAVGGVPIGGMFTRPAVVPVPFWMYYVAVPDIDAAAERVRVGGGQLVKLPMPVPGGAFIVQARDPQGAMFALVGMRG